MTLREIQPLTCKQFVTENNQAMIITVVTIGFLPPFKYIAIAHDDTIVKFQTEPLLKSELESTFNIKL
jgi:hypothetical protein